MVTSHVIATCLPALSAPVPDLNPFLLTLEMDLSDAAIRAAPFKPHLLLAGACTVSISNLVSTVTAACKFAVPADNAQGMHLCRSMRTLLPVAAATATAK